MPVMFRLVSLTLMETMPCDGDIARAGSPHLSVTHAKNLFLLFSVWLFIIFRISMGRGSGASDPARDKSKMVWCGSGLICRWLEE